jgi:hypothetical protein
VEGIVEGPWLSGWQIDKVTTNGQVNSIWPGFRRANNWQDCKSTIARQGLNEAKLKSLGNFYATLLGRNPSREH